jgi:hypothetical protein
MPRGRVSWVGQFSVQNPGVQLKTWTGLCRKSQALSILDGTELRVKPGRKRKTLAELLAATPSDAGRVEGWDEMPAVGTEL